MPPWALGMARGRQGPERGLRVPGGVPCPLSSLWSVLCWSEETLEGSGPGARGSELRGSLGVRPGALFCPWQVGGRGRGPPRCLAWERQQVGQEASSWLVFRARSCSSSQGQVSPRLKTP